MKQLALGFMLAVAFAVGLAAQDYTISFTVTQAQGEVIRRYMIATGQGSPTPTLTEIRDYIIQSCRDSLTMRIKAQTGSEDTVTLADYAALTDVEKDQVRQLILSLKK